MQSKCEQIGETAKPKYCAAILHGEANSSRSEFMCEAQFICEATYGGVAQLGEHLPCKQGVMGSNPIISTKRSFEKEMLKYWLIAQVVRARA